MNEKVYKRADMLCLIDSVTIGSEQYTIETIHLSRLYEDTITLTLSSKDGTFSTLHVKTWQDIQVTPNL